MGALPMFVERMKRGKMDKPSLHVTDDDARTEEVVIRDSIYPFPAPTSEEMPLPHDPAVKLLPEPLMQQLKAVQVVFSALFPLSHAARVRVWEMVAANIEEHDPDPRNERHVPKGDC